MMLNVQMNIYYANTLASNRVRVRAEHLEHVSTLHKSTTVFSQLCVCIRRRAACLNNWQWLANEQHVLRATVDQFGQVQFE